MLRKMFTGFCWLAGTFLFFSPATGFSQEADDAVQSYALGEIVVSAEKGGVEAVGTIREITAEDIETKGARTLDEALELIPGVHVRTGAGGVPRIDYRGFRSRHILLLLDGIPLNSTFDSQFDPSQIPVENIAKIKLAGGTSSVLYGEGDLAGTINIITKKGEKGVQGSVSTEGGNKHFYLGRTTVSGAYDRLNFFVSGSANERDGFRLSHDFDRTSEENGDTRENSDAKRKNFFANFDYQVTDNLDVGLVFNYLKGECGSPPSIINNSKDIYANKPKYERVDDFEGYSTHLAINYDAPGPLSLRSWLYYNELEEDNNRYDNNLYATMIDPKINGTYHDKQKTQIKGASLQATYDLKSAGLVSFGLNARRDEWESDGRIRDVASGKSKPKTYAFRNFDYDEELDIYSVALEYEFCPFDRTGLVLGYRHNWLEKDAGDDDDDGSFLIGAYYDITENMRLRGSAARKVRFPSIRQLYDENGGNQNLGTETSYNYEVGLEYRLPGNTTFTLTGFWIDVDDYIEKIPPTDTYQNNDEYRFQGIEATAETRFIKNLFLRLGYTYMDSEDRTSGSERDELQYRPEHKITLEGTYVFNFGFSAHANIMRVSDQYHYSRKSPMVQRSFNDYTVVNLKLNQDLIDNTCRCYVGIDNLFDENYEEGYAFPQAGRFVYGGVELRF